jgi:hypothetical protein
MQRTLEQMPVLEAVATEVKLPGEPADPTWHPRWVSVGIHRQIGPMFRDQVANITYSTS